MKRIVASVGALALVAVAASPALGFGGFGGYTRFQRPQDTLENKANIDTTINLESNTGHNEQTNGGATLGLGSSGPSYTFGRSSGGSRFNNSDAKVRQHNSLATGLAESLVAGEIHANNGVGCDCFDEVDNEVDSNTNITVKANTGHNDQLNIGGTLGRGGDMTVRQSNSLLTGPAGSQVQLFQVYNSSYEMMPE